ncbi:MAG: molybdopterin molybdotransferase MoeA [Oscillospiraceae bacterium]|jgi:molybdopterin molybdotransferase|nr:molybdopterin molybdotransferase MoeA [Oscillospiraceae bacterium]
MKTNVTPDEARTILFDLPVTAAAETVALPCALNRVLASELTADVAVPPFDRSPFDGYALIAEDTATATAVNPVTLTLTEEIPAGTAPSRRLERGFAAKILTGAPIPDGANATVKFEYTQFNDTEVSVTRPLIPWQDVTRVGEDVKAGAVIAARGTLLTPPLIGIAASAGRFELPVFRLPSAIIINTGSELIEAGEPLPPAKIYNSSAYSLSSYLRGLGFDAVSGGVVRDDAHAIAAKIADALGKCDLVITTGGVSVGDYDYAFDAAQILGADTLFSKARMKPGGAIGAFVKDGRLILSLSGNPGAAIMQLLRIALPYLNKLRGLAECFPAPVEVYLKHAFTKLSTRVRVIRGRLELDGGKAWFVEVGGQTGGVISSFAGADLLAEFPANSPEVPAGSLITAYRVPV